MPRCQASSRLVFPTVRHGSWLRARRALSWPSPSGPAWPRPPSSSPWTAGRSTWSRRCPTGRRWPSSPPTPTPAGRCCATRPRTCMAQAVRRLWPGAKYAIGPVIENGFYYDFELPDGAHFSDDDLDRIDAEMRAIIKEDQPFVRHEHTLEEGLEIFADQPFKQEIIRGRRERGRRGRRRRLGGQHLPQQRRLHRPVPRARTCPRPAGWATSSSCGSPAPTGAATRSASSCSASTGRPGSPRRRWPPTCTSWRRPSGATTASSAPSSTSSASPRRSARASPSSTPRAGPSAG